jgi:hypothetical protein
MDPRFQQHRQEVADAAGAFDDEIGLARDLIGALVGVDAHPEHSFEPPFLGELGQRPESVEVGSVIADVQCGLDVLLG